MHGIVEKLQAILEAGVDNECKVVYVLVESRKLFPRRRPVPFALNLYCNWALHVALDVPQTTAEFLEDVDAFVSSILQGGRDIAAENRAIGHFLLDTFRIQFREFLNSFHLPTALCDEEARWNEFVTHYSGVIADGSISIPRAANAFQHVDRLVFSRGKRERPTMHIPFDLAWEIFLSDGRKLVVEGNAAPLPNGERMSAWGIRIVRR